MNLSRETRTQQRVLGWVAAGAGALAGDVAINLVANLLGGALTRWQQTIVLVSLILLFILIKRRYFSDIEEPEIATEPPASPTEPLPPALALLGRDHLLSAVTATLSQHGLVLVHGPAGMGVSAVAIEAARRLVPAADRQLYLDLESQHTDSDRRVAIRVLSALGQRPGRVPDVAAATEDVRDALRETGRVLVLDNITSPEQVRWVAYRIPGAYVVLAGDIPAPELAGVPDQQVGPLDGTAALELCCEQDTGDHPGSTVSERFVRDPQAASELAEAYLKQPRMAIESGRWLAANPGVSVPALLADLRRQQGASAAARHLLDLQLAGASNDARALLATLTRIPLEEWSEIAVTVLVGNRAPILLDELVRRSLMVRTGPALYRVQGDARALNEGRPGARTSDLTRLVNHYGRLATECAEVLAGGLDNPGLRISGLDTPGLGTSGLGTSGLGTSGLGTQSPSTAERWFRAEDLALLALLNVPDPPRAVAAGLWQIADALEVWFTRENRPADRQGAAETMARLARRLHDASALEAALLRLLAVARARDDLPAAEGYLAELREHVGAPAERGRGSAVLHTNLGLYLLDSGRPEEAQREFQHSRARRPRRDTAGRVVDLTNLGAGLLAAGRLDPARDQLSEALAVAEDSHDIAGRAHALELLGIVAFRQHNRTRAMERWATSKLLYEQQADDLGRARCLLHAGTAVLGAEESSAAEQEAAVESLQQSLALRGSQSTGVGVALAHLYLGEYAARAGRPEADSHRRRGLDALRHWEQRAHPPPLVAATRQRLAALETLTSPLPCRPSPRPSPRRS